MVYVFLMISVISEALATVALQESAGFSKFGPVAVVVICEIITLYYFSLSLVGIPAGIAYAMWSGLSIVLLSLISIFFYSQKFDFTTVVGITFIIFGVCIINLLSKEVL